MLQAPPSLPIAAALNPSLPANYNTAQHKIQKGHKYTLHHENLNVNTHFHSNFHTNAITFKICILQKERKLS